MSWMDRFYSHMPVPLQHGMVSAFGLYWKWLRFGGAYTQFVKDYQVREFYTKEEWDAYQKTQLGRLLKNACDQVPYYRTHWSENQKLSARNGVLAGMPLLDKDEIRQYPFLFVRDDIHAVHSKHFLTSGSTGTPIDTIWTPNEIRDSLAVREVRSANWAGVSFRRPRATFSGRMVVPNPESKGPYHRFNAAEGQVYFSAFHLRPDTAKIYVDAIRQHHVEWMTGYAVSYYLLAKFIIEQQIEIPALKAIITTSEKLTPEMRVVMEKAYGCRVYEEYSTVENALFASECERGRLHVSPDVGIVEILHPDGSPCLDGEVGEVVTTCLMRNYQPLIRYRLGDLAAWSGEPCPCGRAMPVIKEVVGRIEDVVVGPDGRQMVRFHGIFVNQAHVREGQIIQEDLDFIRVLIVPTPEFNNQDIEDITHRVQQRLGHMVRVEVNEVPAIPRTKAGKFQAVVSNVKRADEAR